MLINILIMSPDTHTDPDMLSREPHHTHYAPVWIQGRSHALIISMHPRPQCVWVCIKTQEVSVRLLMTAPVLQGPRGLMTSGNWNPRPWPLNLTCGAGGITSAEAGLTAEQSGMNSNSHTDARRSAADNSHSAANLSEGQDHCSHCCCLLKTNTNCAGA